MTDGEWIEQFMWRYQHGFRAMVEIEAESLLGQTGFAGYPMVILIGFPVTSSQDAGICVEPEDDIYTPADLAAVPARADVLYTQHPEHGMYYGDDKSREELPARLRDEMRALAIQETLRDHPSSAGRTFFASRSARIGDHEVHIVVSVDSDALQHVPQLEFPADPRSPVVPSIIHAIIFELLDQAHRELYIPDAGHVGVGGFSYDAPEISLRAVRRMVRSALHLTGYDFGSEAVPELQSFVSLLYEGRPNAGRLVIAPQDDPAVSVEVGLAQPVLLSNQRQLRKLLEPTGLGMALLMRDRDVYGLGTATSGDGVSHERIFEITIGSSGTWHLARAGTRLLTVQDSLPKLPAPQLDTPLLKDIITRILPAADLDKLVSLATAASNNRHGAMLIISSGAAAEAIRLAPQATLTTPGQLTPQAMEQLTNMDGGVLVDPQGLCHAIGVILDGTARGNGDPARGSRFNNAVRYLDSNPPPAVILSCSSDGDITILPVLRPRRRSSEIGALVDRYVAACSTSPPRQRATAAVEDRLNDVRFYLSAEQCAQINQARADLNTWREANGQAVHIKPDLTPDPAMNDTYWLPGERG
ncbi:MAG: hypothetical protein ACRDPY_28640 [Streptosporangiaceae bacterium]